MECGREQQLTVIEFDDLQLKRQTTSVCHLALNYRSASLRAYI